MISQASKICDWAKKKNRWRGRNDMYPRCGRFSSMVIDSAWKIMILVLAQSEA